MKKILSILLLALVVFTLTSCKSTEDEFTFDLILGESYQIDLYQTYIDPGFIAKYQTEDISDYVIISGNVDSDVAGTYIITYTLVYEGTVLDRFRTVTVGNFNSRCTDIVDTDLMSCNYIWSGTYLNTVVKLTLYVDKDTEVNTDVIFEEVEDILAYYTIMSDKYKSYDGMMNVHEINQNPSSTNILDERLFNLIDFTFAHQEEVNYLFNASLGPVLQVWHDYRDNCTDNDICQVPSMILLNEADLYTDPSKVILDEVNSTITMENNMGLDLGGVSKGYVSREIIEYLDSLDLHGYLLNNGESNISIGGNHPTRENSKFIIAITDPTYALPYYATIYLEDGEQLVTSGDYQKYYEVDGISYHHIINPNTLMPEYHSKSVSIIMTDPALADLYSTAIFNMTVTEGQAFVNSKLGLEAIWYGTDGTIYFSENFETNYLIDTFE